MVVHHIDRHTYFAVDAYPKWVDVHHVIRMCIIINVLLQDLCQVFSNPIQSKPVCYIHHTEESCVQQWNCFCLERDQ